MSNTNTLAAPAPVAFNDDAAEMRKELARLRAENEKLKGTAPKGITIKVSEKGCVSVYGLGRFPVTLYKSQMVKLLAHAEDIKTFMENNADILADKA